MTLLGDDGIVHINRAERRLVMIDFGEDIGHVDYAEHRLVVTDLEDDVIVHADWAEHRLVMIGGGGQKF